MFKRSPLSTLLVVLMVLSLLFSACTPVEITEEATEEPTAEMTEEPTEEATEPPDEKVQVDVWYHSGRAPEREALLAAFGGEFEEANPNIQINLVELPEGGYNDQVQSAAIAGNLPCVLDFDGPFVYNYVWGEYLIPLNPYFSDEELDDFLPSIIEQGTYQDGKLYSLGQYDSGLAIWGRKSYLEEAGVRIPTIEEPWTREEFNAALKDLRDLPDTKYAIDLKMNYAQSVPSEWLTYGFSPILQSFGADLIDRETYATAEGVLNGPEAIKAMSMIQNWFDAGYANATPADDTCFTSGDCALAYVGHWATAGHIDAVGDDLILLPMPDFGEGPKSGMGSWNWGITSQCANPDAAAEVLRYIVSPESIRRMTELNGAVPARISVFEQDERYQEGGLLYTFVQQLNRGWAVPRPVTPAYPTITAAFSVAFKNIATGADVQDELDSAVDKIQEDLEANDYYGGVAGEQPAEPEEVKVVDMWYHSGRAPEREALLATFSGEFEKANPNIVVNMIELPEGGYNDQVQAAAIAGNLPCVLDFDGPFVYNYVWGEYLIPLNPYFSEDDLSDFLPSIIDQGTYQDGKLYSLGQYDSGLAIWGRKSYLEEAGVRIPTIEEPWTREEFNAALKDLRDLPDTKYAIDLKMNYAQSVPSEWLTYGFSPILQSFGADLIDRETYETAEGILNGPEAVEAMTMIQGWFENGYANATPADDTCFVSGKCALAYVGHWATAGHVDAVGDDLILLPMPDFGEGPKSGMGSWNWGLTSQCDHPDAAAEVLRYIVSPESIRRMTELNGAVPARISVFEQDERYQEGGLLYTFVQQLNRGWAVPRPVTPAYPTITAAFSVAFKNIATGADVQDELDTAVDKIQEDLEANDFYK